jgi:hypothetical protein
MSSVLILCVRFLSVSIYGHKKVLSGSRTSTTTAAIFMLPRSVGYWN